MKRREDPTRRPARAHLASAGIPVRIGGWIGIGLLLGLGACSERSPGSPAAIAAGKNLLLVTLDTTRADALSCLGSRPLATPHLDALAERSTLFTRAFSETNFTNPSHLTIFTGLRAIEHGVFANDSTSPPEPQLLTEALIAAGYDTAGFPAIRHLARVTDRGFRTFSIVDEEQSAEENTDRALAWLDTRRAERFFLWVHYFDAHSLYEPAASDAAAFYSGDREAGDGPRLADDPYFDLQSTPRSLVNWLGDTRDPAWPRAMYAAEVHTVDREFGRLLVGLKERGAAADTVIVVLGDHGESLGEHGVFYDHKGLFEESLHIPMIVHVPGLAPGRSDALVSTLDVAPTVAELFGVKLSHPLSGQSLVPLLDRRESPASGPAPWRTSLVHQHARNQGLAIREDGWKLILPVNADYPLFRNGPQLFHLAVDPREEQNIAASNPDRVERLRAQLTPWIQLGPHPSSASELDEDSLRELRALGYADE